MATIEANVYDFISERVAAASSDPPTLAGYAPEVVEALAGLEVLPDEFANITRARGVRLADMVAARVAPTGGFAGVRHFDCLLVLIVYVAVARSDRQSRRTYRDQAVAIAEAVAMLFYKEPDMRVLATGVPREQNSRPLHLPRGSDSIDGKTYSVANLQLVINETGQIDFTGKR